MASKSQFHRRVLVARTRINHLKHVVSFYQFTRIEEPELAKTKLAPQLSSAGIVGTVLLAPEGINATLSHANIGSLEQTIRQVEEALGFKIGKAKYSTARDANPVFFRLKIKVRDEIIQFGHTLDSDDSVGIHVGPERWNQLLDDPDVLVVDVRNDYEATVGTFESAEVVGIQRFGEFEGELERLAEQANGRAIAMFCTGGIRCEKASYALLRKGCEKVYQLDGGILGYLETVAQDDSKWHGECFVFDQRVTVDAELQQGSYDQCHACRRPISAQDQQSPDYVKSVSCPYCIDETTDRQKSQFAERAKQEALAQERGSKHLGSHQNQLV